MSLRAVQRLQTIGNFLRPASAMSASLPPTIHQGILNVPGATAESKATVERLLDDDRKTHHCLFGKGGFHNHASHHLLAAYDLGAPAKLLEAIYDEGKKGLNPLRPDASTTKEPYTVTITRGNWTQYLGTDYEHLYADYLEFFAKEIQTSGIGQTLEDYVFSHAANGNGSCMLLRFVSGAVHPMIQTGYGVEFGSDVMVAQALAQAAAHSPFAPEIFDLQELSNQTGGVKSNAAEEIQRLSALWKVDITRGQRELDEKVEELLWLTTLLFAGSGRRGRKPRLDFFLMHMLNVTLFVPSLLNAIPTIESKALLLRATLPVFLLYLIMRGRPRIDPELMMSYTANPRPPKSENAPAPDSSALGDPRRDEFANPWPAIVASVLHAPDPHTVKAIRALYYAAQKYGTTPAGGAIGAFQPNGEETHKGTSKTDGTIFVRAAGVVMDVLGWVSHGQEEGTWDRSALGWDDAWKTDGMKSVKATT
ncbi:unnamed protein product [Somion occarium]|uniref:Oxidoreductase AflY n=1 Tax=Somion occarium TaxID=3059160 RepID=A0ABP1DZV0_9APHY